MNPAGAPWPGDGPRPGAAMAAGALSPPATVGDTGDTPPRPGRERRRAPTSHRAVRHRIIPATARPHVSDARAARVTSCTALAGRVVRHTRCAESRPLRSRTQSTQDDEHDGRSSKHRKNLSTSSRVRPDRQSARSPICAHPVAARHQRCAAVATSSVTRRPRTNQRRNAMRRFPSV